MTARGGEFLCMMMPHVAARLRLSGKAEMGLTSIRIFAISLSPIFYAFFYFPLPEFVPAAAHGKYRFKDSFPVHLFPTFVFILFNHTINTLLPPKKKGQPAKAN
jgi:hypothetical protein